MYPAKEGSVIVTIFTLAGIGLFVTKHPGWGSVCFIIALATVAF
jgi:hypothetical protein